MRPMEFISALAQKCIWYSGGQNWWAGGMKIRQGFLATVPTRALVIFALGIFFLFSTIGIASDMTQMGRQPVARYLLITLVISVFAIGYAAAGTILRGRSWKVMIPLFVFQFLLISQLNALFPSLPPLKLLNSEDVAWLNRRLGWDGVGIVAATFLGYGCFIYAS